MHSRNHLYTLLFVLTVAAATLLCAHKAPAQKAMWRLLDKGLEYRSVPLGKNKYPAMAQVRLSTDYHPMGLAIAKDYGLKGMSISSLRKKSKALVAINGGYFDENMVPLGYQREKDRLIVPDIAWGNAFTGVFFVYLGKAGILHRDDFDPGYCQVALQAGPRLVAGGKATEGLSGSPTRLSGVAVDQQGRVVIYCTDLTGLMTLREAQQFLMAPEAKGGINPRHILNLDGGSSSGISIKTKDFSLEKPALSDLPAALIVR